MSEENVILKIIKRSDGDLTVLIKTELGTHPINVLNALNKATGDVLSKMRDNRHSSEWSEAGSASSNRHHREEKSSESTMVLDGIGALAFLTMLEKWSQEAKDKKGAQSDKKQEAPDKESAPKQETENKTDEQAPINH